VRVLVDGPYAKVVEAVKLQAALFASSPKSVLSLGDVNSEARL
jgi:hypothetical protein